MFRCAGGVHQITDVDHGSRRCPRVQYDPWPDRWNLYNCLVGLDFDQRLVGLDPVADLDEPGDDLGLGEAVSQIGELELVRHY